MEVRVQKKKVFKQLPGKLIPRRVIKYTMIWSENGYCDIKEFNDKLDLINFLIHENIYKGEPFPYNVVGLEEFMEKGFSIFY